MPTNYNQYQVPQTITMFTVHGEEVNSAVKAALQKYFPQINFGE